MTEKSKENKTGNNKKLIIIAIILLFLLFGAIGGYFLLKNKNKDTETKDGNTTSEQQNNDDNNSSDNTTPNPPTFVYGTSSEAILATSEQAKEWANDAQLYDCSGLTTSTYSTGTTVYKYVGAQEGDFSRWNCTYYSKTRHATNIFSYVNGKPEQPGEELDIGEYGKYLYDDINYPTNLTKIADSKDLYAKAITLGLDIENNYVNIYLANTQDYGYVWRIDERSKTDKDEYDVGVIVNVYVFGRDNGELIEITQESVF